MSGTGHFRGAGPGSRSGGTADLVQEHLGDRLAAFVDGELKDDARERVLSHLATCDGCKTEADEQRRLKNAVAGALPPALSAGLLARLQGLPGCPSGGPDDPDGPAGPDGRAQFGRGGGFAGLGEIFGSRGEVARSYLAPAAEPLEGFPIHEVSRSASRGRRLAFAAAGAFSLAALALGAAVPLDGLLGPVEPAGGPSTPGATPAGLSGVSGPRSGPPAVTPVSVDVSRPLLAPHGGHAPLDPADAPRSSRGASGAVSPSAGPSPSAAAPSASPTASPVPTVHDAGPMSGAGQHPVAPVALPLPGLTAPAGGPLSVPRPLDRADR